MSKFRFVAVSPSRIEERKRLGPAVYLHEFLTDHQTSADGWVFYGKEFGYAWIRARWLACPPLRTVKRHMAKLKALGLVEVHRMLRGGMRVRLLASVKFAKPLDAPAVQMALFAPKVTPIRVTVPVGNSVDNHQNPDSNSAKSGTLTVPKVAPERSKKQIKETISAIAQLHSLPPVEKSKAELDARRRLLLDQVDEMQKKYQTSR